MDGIHDLGGKQGFGPVTEDPTPAGFDERWHAAVFAMVNSLGFAGITRNTDHFRHAVERIDPRNYLNDGYYGRWLGAVETLLTEGGPISAEALAAYYRKQGVGPAVRSSSAVTGDPLVVPEKRTSSARRTSSASASTSPVAPSGSRPHGSRWTSGSAETIESCTRSSRARASSINGFGATM